MNSSRVVRALTVGLAGVIAIVLAWTTIAHAADLGVVGGQQSLVHTNGFHQCTSGPLTVAPSGTPNNGQYTQVTVSGINGTCSVGAVAVIMAQAPNTVRFVGSGAVSGNSFTATSNAFTPPNTAAGWAFVAVDGWVIPATWQHTPPTPPASAISCAPVDPNVTATCTVNVSQWNFWGSGYRVDFTITTTSPTPFQWELRFDIGKQVTPPNTSGGAPLFPGYPVPAGAWWPQWTPAGFTHSNVCSVGTNAQLPVVRLRGPYAWNRNVSASQPATSMGFQAAQSGGGPLGGSGIPAC